MLIRCSDCGAPAERLGVNLIGFAMAAPQRGEHVRNYMDAAKELEYRHERTDDPALAAVSQVYRPAYYRANALLHEPGADPERRWTPQGGE